MYLREGYSLRLRINDIKVIILHNLGPKLDNELGIFCGSDKGMLRAQKAGRQMRHRLKKFSYCHT